MDKHPQTYNQSDNLPEISIEKDKPLNIKHVILILTGIAVLTFLAYYPSFKNKILNWDDDTYIIYNPYIHSFALDNVKTLFTRGYFNNYHPLTMLSYNLDYNIGKSDPEVYIITNLILHILNTFLVFWFILLLAKLPAENKENLFNGKKPFYLAAIASLLFALHPLNVESVAWIAERKNLLCTFFFLLSLISYIKYLGQKRFLFYYVSLILFLFSLFSKGIAVSLSFSVVALDYLYARKLLSVKVVLEKVPFFLLSLAFGIIALNCQGLKNVGAGHSYINQLFFASYGFIAYLFNLILPVNLSGFYSYPHGIHFIHVLCFILALAIITILFIFRKKLSRLVIFSILFFLANIIFQLQLIPVGKSIMADRYIYISSIGFFLIVAFIILKIAPKYKVVYILLSISLLLFGYATHERVKEWNNSLLFWDTVIGKDPSNSLAWRNRGSAKANKKDYQGALADFRKSIELNPDDPVAFYDEGLIKIDNGDYNGGLEDFNTVLKIQPYYTNALYYRGNVRREMGDNNGALEDFSRAILINPNFKDAYNNRGITYCNIGKLDVALADFTKAIELDPGYADSYYNRGKLRKIAKDYSGALSDLDHAIQLNPKFTNAYSLRAKVKLKLGVPEGAFDDCNVALLLDSNITTVSVTLVSALFQLGKYSEAIDKINNLLQSNSQSGILYYIRGMCCMKSGKNEAGNHNILTAQKLGFSPGQNEFTMDMK